MLNSNSGGPTTPYRDTVSAPSPPAQPSSRASLACPLCGGEGVRRFVNYNIYIADCKSCNHRFADLVPEQDHVTRHYDDNYFVGGGAGYANYISQAGLLRKHGQRYARMLRRYAQPGTMADIGASAGLILQGFVDEGWRGIGVEPNATMAAYARDQLGLDVRTGTLEDLSGESQFDLVTMIQVVAHLIDPAKAIQSVHELLRGGGHCLIETWDYRSWTAGLFGRNWHEYSPPTVLHWFSTKGLTDHMQRHGFHLVAKGRPAKYLSGAHAKSLLRYKLGTSAGGRICSALLNVIPDRLTLRYPADDLFWALFRKSGA